MCYSKTHESNCTRLKSQYFWNGRFLRLVWGIWLFICWIGSKFSKIFEVNIRILNVRLQVLFNVVCTVIILQCVDKPTRYNTSYGWSLFSIIWLYMFWTTTSPSSGASSHKLHKVLVCSCKLACTNIPIRYTVYEMMLLMNVWW